MGNGRPLRPAVQPLFPHWQRLDVGLCRGCVRPQCPHRQLGVLWNKNVSFVFIRPQRYTLEFLKSQTHYALNFFDKSYRSALNYFGSHSGRDGDKDQATGLHIRLDQAAPYYEEARMVLLCKKLSMQQMDPASFLDPSIDEAYYPQKDYHQAFVGEIETVLLKK